MPANSKKGDNACKQKRVAYFHNRFPRYKEIQIHLISLTKTFPNYVQVETIGQSLQGRDIYMVVISKRHTSKETIATFIDANIHAREWIANSTALYLIDYLVRHRSILNVSKFYIVPCLNPDGYEYTHTQNRLWRKNRNLNNTTDVKKQGVDLNRNFPLGYGLRGSSSVPSSFMYRGECALSEPESQALADTLDKYQKEIKLYISIHCYGNVILFPWGFTKYPVPDRDELEKCGYACKEAMAQVSKLKDRHFKVGSVASKMYISSGGSADYAKGVNNIKFSYTLELQKYGKSGFTPTTNRIVEIGNETTFGILAMVKYVYKYYQLKCTKRD